MARNAARQNVINKVKELNATWDWEYTPEISYIALEAPLGFLWQEQKAHTLICLDWYDAEKRILNASLMPEHPA